MKKTFLMLLTLVLSLLTCVSCSEETLDYTNPDVDLFVRQLKAGNYNLAIVFSSSIRGDHFEGAPGSTLYIDEVLLNFTNK